MRRLWPVKPGDFFEGIRLELRKGPGRRTSEAQGPDSIGQLILSQLAQTRPKAANVNHEIAANGLEAPDSAGSQAPSVDKAPRCQPGGGLCSPAIKLEAFWALMCSFFAQSLTEHQLTRVIS
jgi:hypothetical protein